MRTSLVSESSPFNRYPINGEKEGDYLALRMQAAALKSITPPKYSWELVLFLIKQSLPQILGEWEPDEILPLSKSLYVDPPIDTDQTVRKTEKTFRQVVRRRRVKIERRIREPAELKTQEAVLIGSLPASTTTITNKRRKKVQKKEIDESCPAATTPQVPLCYQSLLVSVKEGETIKNLLGIVANTPAVGLLFQQPELERVGDGIRNVHPLRFIGFILSDPDLFTYMCKIRNSFLSLKWNGGYFPGGGFVNRLSDEVRREIRDQGVEPYIVGFAESLGFTLQEIQPFFDSNKIEEMMEFIMDAKLKNA